MRADPAGHVTAAGGLHVGGFTPATVLADPFDAQSRALLAGDERAVWRRSTPADTRQRGSHWP